MKKSIVFIAFILIFNFGYSQDDTDRTGFKGEVLSSLRIVTNEQADSKKETQVETVILFDSKTISIDEEVYDIVNKEFDGIDTNTFLCTKRGSNFTITFIVEDHISLVDNSNPTIVTYYLDLLE